MKNIKVTESNINQLKIGEPCLVGSPGCLRLCCVLANNSLVYKNSEGELKYPLTSSVYKLKSADYDYVDVLHESLNIDRGNSIRFNPVYNLTYFKKGSKVSIGIYFRRNNTYRFKELVSLKDVSSLEEDIKDFIKSTTESEQRKAGIVLLNMFDAGSELTSRNNAEVWIGKLTNPVRYVFPDPKAQTSDNYHYYTGITDLGKKVTSYSYHNFQKVKTFNNVDNFQELVDTVNTPLFKTPALQYSGMTNKIYFLDTYKSVNKSNLKRFAKEIQEDVEQFVENNDPDDVIQISEGSNVIGHAFIK